MANPGTRLGKSIRQTHMQQLPSFLPAYFPLGLPRTENAVLSSTPKEEEQQDEEGKKNKFKL